MRGLLGTDPPDPNLESASPSPSQGSIWHWFTIDSTWNRHRFPDLTQFRWATQMRGWGPGGLRLINASHQKCPQYCWEFHDQLWEALSRTTSEKRGAPSLTGGERILEMLWKPQMPWIIGFGGSQPYSRGEFQEELWERFRGLSWIFPEFLPESASRTGGTAHHKDSLDRSFSSVSVTLLAKFLWLCWRFWSPFCLSPLGSPNCGRVKFDRSNRHYFNSVHTRCIVKTSGFTRGVCKNQGFY